MVKVPPRFLTCNGVLRLTKVTASRSSTIVNIMNIWYLHGVKLPVRIYYEDTDCGAVVYYANYLKYFERGRTELLRERGVLLGTLRDEGILFVVSRVDIRYLSPGRHDDLLTLETRITSVTGATVTFEHAMTNEKTGVRIVDGTVALAAVDRDGRPMRIPQKLRGVLSQDSALQ